MKKVRVIKDFIDSGVEYKIGDKLLVIKSNYDIELIITKNLRNSICELNSIFASNKFETIIDL